MAQKRTLTQRMAQQYQQQHPQPQYQQQPARAVTRGGRSAGWHISQILITFMTGGLYLPWYLSKWSKARSQVSRTTFYDH